MRKILLSGFLLLLLSSVLMAQNSNNKKNCRKKIVKVEKVTSTSEETDLEDEDVSPIMDVEVSSSETSKVLFKSVKNIKNSNRFLVAEKINDQYSFYYDKNARNHSNCLGIVDNSGTVVLPHLFSREQDFDSKTEVILGINSSKGLYNLNKLRWSIPLMYEKLKYLGNNLYLAKMYDKWGVVDCNNKTIVPFNYSEIFPIENMENYIKVAKNGHSRETYGVYSLAERRLTIPCVYTLLYVVEKQSYFYASNGSKCNIIDVNNVPRFKQWYKEINYSSNTQNYFIVTLDAKHGVIDDSERVVVPIEYLEIDQEPFSDGSYFARNKDGKCGFITIDGKVTLPFLYDEITKWGHNLMEVVKNGKHGIVRVNSGIPSEIATCEYDSIAGNSEFFIVKKNDRFGLLNENGIVTLDIKYQLLEDLGKRVSNGPAYIAKYNDAFELIDEQGVVFTKEAYSELSIIPNSEHDSFYYTDFSFLKFKSKNGKCGVISKLGLPVVQSSFDDIISENKGVLIVQQDGKYGLYSLKSNKMIADCEYDNLLLLNRKYHAFIGKDIFFLTVELNKVKKSSTIN